MIQWGGGWWLAAAQLAPEPPEKEAPGDGFWWPGLGWGDGAVWQVPSRLCLTFELWRGCGRCSMGRVGSLGPPGLEPFLVSPQQAQDRALGESLPQGGRHCFDTQEASISERLSTR